jgi:hypothetical protein
MSNYVNGATHALNWNGFCFQDVRLHRMDFRPIQEFADVWAIPSASYVTDWWPGGAKLSGEPGVNAEFESAVLWGDYDQAGGASSRFGFVGVTRDAYGTPIAACTVKLFRTSDDLLLDTTISDPSGNYLLNTAYYPDTHYLVAHKTGSPDVDGVSVNTLIGT